MIFSTEVTSVFPDLLKENSTISPGKLGALVEQGPCIDRLFPVPGNVYHVNGTYTTLTYVYIVVELVFFILILLGNGLVLASFCLFHSIRKKLPHHWLFHLAFADLLLGLVLPYHVYTFLDPTAFESYGDWPYMCLARYASAAISLEASLVFLVLLSLHVLLSVLSPYKFNAWMTPVKLHLVAVLAWIACILYGTLPLLGFHNYGESEKGGTTCELAVVWEPWYIYLMIWLKVILTTSLCIIYFFVFRIANQFARRDSSIFLHLSGSVSKNTKAIRTFVIVSLSTIICFFPFGVVLYLQSYKWQEMDQIPAEDGVLTWLSALSILGLFLHSCLNPMIYSLRLPAFRKSFKAILTGKCSKLRAEQVD